MPAAVRSAPGPGRSLFDEPTRLGDIDSHLLEATRPYKNFIVSSGCDIPPGAPLANLNAFYRAVAEFNK